MYVCMCVCVWMYTTVLDLPSMADSVSGAEEAEKLRGRERGGGREGGREGEERGERGWF